MRHRETGVLLCICILAVCIPLQTACTDATTNDPGSGNGAGNGDQGSSDTDTDTDTDTDIDTDTDVDTDTDADADTDTDTDADADSDCPAVTWGSGLTTNQPVANWSQDGYIDSNDDGVVEQDPVTFDLEQIHCSGKQSMVFVVGDVT